MVDIEALLHAARGFAPTGVALAGCDPAAPAPPLWPGEALAKAVPRRVAEFSAGRAAARAAMAALNAAPAAIPQGPDRAPIWPPGLHGSITHSATACLAAITHAPRLIGIDLEPATPLAPELWHSVLLPVERAAVAQTDSPGLHAKLIFSAKEAAYKAQYLRSHTLLDFDAMEITLGPGHFADHFTARFTKPVPGFATNATLMGRHCRVAGHILTFFAA